MSINDSTAFQSVPVYYLTSAERQSGAGLPAAVDVNPSHLMRWCAH